MLKLTKKQSKRYPLYTGNAGYNFLHKKLIEKRLSPHSKPKILTITLDEKTHSHEELHNNVNELKNIGDIKIIPIPILHDNYSYLIKDVKRNEGILVDPSDPYAVFNFVDKENVNIIAILTTHRHWDHAGGNDILLSKLATKNMKNIKVFGSIQTKSNSRASITNIISHNQIFQIGRFIFTSLYVPGHTLSDISFILHHYLLSTSTNDIQHEDDDKEEDLKYIVENKVKGWSVFTGDVLFIGSCGKFFESTPPVMFHSLQTLSNIHSYDKKKKKHLSDSHIGENINNNNININNNNNNNDIIDYQMMISNDEKEKKDKKTFIWPGHEYTLSNFLFIVSIDPNNQYLLSKLQDVKKLRGDGESTVPSTLYEELIYNPFLRTDQPPISQIVKNNVNLSPIQQQILVLATLRNLKDQFIVPQIDS